MMAIIHPDTQTATLFIHVATGSPAGLATEQELFDDDWMNMTDSASKSKGEVTDVK
jgi:hypothetical protein